MSYIHPADLDYTTTDKCDGCDERDVEGTMFHAQGATGRICPVLFLCWKCQQPDVPKNNEAA